MPEGQEYAIEFIAGGVVKDKDGNVIDDSSERAAQTRLKELGITNVLAEEE
jgi:hypothetical protein